MVAVLASPAASWVNGEHVVVEVATPSASDSEDSGMRRRRGLVDTTPRPRCWQAVRVLIDLESLHTEPGRVIAKDAVVALPCAGPKRTADGGARAPQCCRTAHQRGPAVGCTEDYPALRAGGRALPRRGGHDLYGSDGGDGIGARGERSGNRTAGLPSPARATPARPIYPSGSRSVARRGCGALLPRQSGIWSDGGCGKLLHARRRVQVPAARPGRRSRRSYRSRGHTRGVPVARHHHGPPPDPNGCGGRRRRGALSGGDVVGFVVGHVGGTGDLGCGVLVAVGGVLYGRCRRGRGISGRCRLPRAGSTARW